MKSTRRSAVQSNNTSDRRRAISNAVATALMVGTASAWAGPSGEQVTAGQATVSRGGSNTLINQTTDRAAINWQNFNIGASESVRFVQPSAASVTLNRVNSGRATTEILGSLSANGQIFIVNQSGVIFGQGAQVNVGGLVVSGLALSDRDFMAGNYKFINDKPPNQSGGTVVNSGNVVANGGYVVLLGSQIRNDGKITANGGKVVLAGGNEITVRLNGSKLIDLTVDQGWFNSSVENSDSGVIKADGGQVLLTAAGVDRLIRSVVNSNGTVEANTVSNVGGTIMLDYETVVVAPGVKGVVVNSGLIEANTVSDVSGVIRIEGGNVGNSVLGTLRAEGSANVDATQFGPNGNYIGQGGKIEIRGDTVALSGFVSADGARGGSIDVMAFGGAGLNITYANVSARGLKLNGGRITYLTMPRTGGRIYNNGFGRTDVSGVTHGGTISIFGDGGVFTSGRYYARGETGNGGMINISGPVVGLIAAHLDASGASGGGGVGVGLFIEPWWRGGRSPPDFDWAREIGWRDPTDFSYGCYGCSTPGFHSNARTLIDGDSRIDVSSSQGKGGYAAVWGGRENTMLGGIDARGAAGGGKISISSGETVRITDLANVYSGVGGQLNISAENLVVGDSATAAGWVSNFRRETGAPTSPEIHAVDSNGRPVPLSDIDRSVASGTSVGNGTLSPAVAVAPVKVSGSEIIISAQPKRSVASIVNREVAGLAGAATGTPMTTPAAIGMVTVIDGGLNVPPDVQ